MKKFLLRQLLSVTLKPFLEHYYLKSERPFIYGDLKLKVKPSVFHPGLFFSSKFMAQFIKQLNLTDKRLLDMGCGSGLLSLVAAQKGAKVLSVDLNEQALQNTQTNANLNGLEIDTIKSDIFAQISGEFDFIIVNPPYYPRKAKDDAQLAWYCGASFEYFERFFGHLAHHITPSTEVYMVLSEGCELQRIRAIANERHFAMTCVKTLDGVLESSFIFRIGAE